MGCGRCLVEGVWGSCVSLAGVCGDGRRERAVWCSEVHGRIVLEFLCDQQARPPKVKPCFIACNHHRGNHISLQICTTRWRDNFSFTLFILHLPPLYFFTGTFNFLTISLKYLDAKRHRRVMLCLQIVILIWCIKRYLRIIGCVPRVFLCKGNKEGKQKLNKTEVIKPTDSNKKNKQNIVCVKRKD